MDDVRDPPDLKNGAGEEVMLCPGCMTPNEPRADFCCKCGMPIGALTTYDPIKRIYSLGWFYRKAISGRVSPIIFWGMWLIFGSGVFWLLAYMCDTAVFFPDITSLVFLPFAVGLLILYGVILYLVTLRYLRSRRIRPGFCEECGYSLRGLPEPRCPACGTRFDPAEQSDYEVADSEND